VNIENFMDPMGGEGPDTVNAGLLGILGFGLDHGIYNKVIGNRILGEAGYLGSPWSKGQLKDRVRQKRKSDAKWMRKRGSPKKQANFIAKKMSKVPHNRRPIISGIGRDIGKIRSSVASQSKWSRRLGWAFIASGLFELGEMMATPGISKAAARSNQQLMMDERPIDSGMAATQRQRGLQAIYSSQSALGNQIFGQEANYLHR